jgi:hypothetical protein
VPSDESRPLFVQAFVDSMPLDVDALVKASRFKNSHFFETLSADYERYRTFLVTVSQIFLVTVSQIEAPQLAVLTAKGVTLDSNGNLIVQGEKDSSAFSPDLWESFEVKRLPSTVNDDDAPGL